MWPARTPACGFAGDGLLSMFTFSPPSPADAEPARAQHYEDYELADGFQRDVLARMDAIHLLCEKIDERVSIVEQEVRQLRVEGPARRLSARFVEPTGAP